MGTRSHQRRFSDDPTDGPNLSTGLPVSSMVLNRRKSSNDSGTIDIGIRRLSNENVEKESIPVISSTKADCLRRQSIAMKYNPLFSESVTNYTSGMASKEKVGLKFALILYST